MQNCGNEFYILNTTPLLGGINRFNSYIKKFHKLIRDLRRKVMDEKERYESAKKQVMEMKSFYSHLIVYLIMAVFFIVINLVTSPGVYWFYWPIIGWGIGVFFHGMETFKKGTFGKNWEEKKIQEIMQKDRK